MILSSANNHLIESYVFEFIDDYIFCLSQFYVAGFHPSLPKKIIKQTNQLAEINFLQEYSDKINQHKLKIEEQLLQLEASLNGE